MRFLQRENRTNVVDWLAPVCLSLGGFFWGTPARSDEPAVPPTTDVATEQPGDETSEFADRRGHRERRRGEDSATDDRRDGDRRDDRHPGFGRHRRGDRQQAEGRDRRRGERPRFAGRGWGEHRRGGHERHAAWSGPRERHFRGGFGRGFGDRPRGRDAGPGPGPRGEIATLLQDLQREIHALRREVRELREDRGAQARNDRGPGDRPDRRGFGRGWGRDDGPRGSFRGERREGDRERGWDRDRRPERGPERPPQDQPPQSSERIEPSDEPRAADAGDSIRPLTPAMPEDPATPA